MMFNHSKYELLFMVGMTALLIIPRFAYAQRKASLKEDKRPNIILFLVDDMGWEDSSVPFWDSAVASNKKFYTPNMVKLAMHSEKFTNAYADCVCSPSRVSLMTGMNEARTRVTNYTNPAHKDRTTDARDSIFREVPWNINGLSPFPGIPHTVYATPFPALLRDAGYYTIQAGKGHFGPPGTPGSNLRNLGFDVVIGGHAAGSPQSYLGQENYGNLPGHTTIRAVPDLEEYYGTDTFLSKALTLEAIKALYAPVHYHMPFFLYMAHYAVHLPYNADKRFIQRYLEEGYTRSEASYCALIQGMDRSLGTLMHYLQQHHLAKNTIIIFMSDNGGFSHPPREGKPNTQNYPLRAGKGSLYEGGIREPMMVYWPGITRPGSVCGQYVDIQDFFPTILQMAGIKHYKTVQPIDGKSIVPYLKNPTLRDNKRFLVWNFPNNWTNRYGADYNYQCAVRQGNWKLIYLEKFGRLELYNLKDDIKEQHDLSKKYPEKTKEMAGWLTKRLKRYHAQMPVYRDTGKPVPWPDEING